MPWIEEGIVKRRSPLLSGIFFNPIHKFMLGRKETD